MVDNTPELPVLEKANPTSKSSTNAFEPTDRNIWEPALEKVRDSMATAMVRRPTEKHWTFRLLARACKRRSINSDAMNVLLGISADQQLTTQSKVDGVFIGISATNCEPVVMLRHEFSNVRDRPISLDNQTFVNLDNTGMVTFQSQSLQDVTATEIIWTEAMLIPGNISHAKRALWNLLGKNEKIQFLKIMMREHSRLGAGLSSAGVAKILPSNEKQERKPAICRLIHLFMDYSRMHYVLQWPPMAVLEFPPDMIGAVEEFLSYYPQDNVPLNIALAATIIYFDLEEGGQQRGERFAEHWEPETALKSDGFYRIKRSRGSLDEDEMRLLYSKIWTRHPQVPADFRFSLIPASMPGTSMVFPQDCTQAQNPTSDLHTLCCLNDIRTMGFPDYGADVELISGLRYVGGPQWVFSKMLDTPITRLDGPLWASYWKPVSSGGIKALRGVAKTIGPVFPHVGSSCYKDVYITECVKRHFGMVEFFTKNFTISKHLPDYIFKDIHTKAKELRKVFTYLGKKRSAWNFNLETLTPSWKGMENDLNSLHEKGELEKVASGSLKRAAPEEPIRPAAKRVKLAKRCLSIELRAQILGIIGGLAVRSLDWYPLRHYLKSTTNPSLNEARDLLSEVQSLKSEIQETLPASDAGNCKGSLDKVIRMCFRAGGLFDRPQAKSVDYEQQWDKYRENFSEVDKTTAGILNTFYKYRNTDGAFEDFLPMVGLLRESPMIKGQIDACTEIEGLLETARTIVKIRTPSQNDQVQS
ncbi:polyketide synthase [Fusarium coicis]|nr:polyketide synthase [Fusarium coicis]